MSDAIYLRRLSVETIIGIDATERSSVREVMLDIKCQLRQRPAMADDTIDSTVDYRTVVARVREFTAASNYQLLESLAEAIAALLMREFPIQQVHIRAAKPGILPAVEEVGVEIVRLRDGKGG